MRAKDLLSRAIQGNAAVTRVQAVCILDGRHAYTSDPRRRPGGRGDGGGRGGPHGSRRPASAGPDQHPDQARRRPLRRERVLRPLLRHLPQRDQPGGAAPVHRQGRHALRQRARSDPADQQPELVPAAAAGPLRGGHLLAEPRLRRRAAGVRRRPDGQVPGVHGGRLVRCTRQVDRHGLLRRQHGHGPVEPRPELRDERQLVRHELRAVDGRRDQPGLRPDPRDRRAERLRRREQHDHRRPAAQARRLRQPERRPTLGQERG